MLLNRTLYLHSLSPLHIPPPLRQHRGGGGTGPQAAANSVLTTQQLDIIGKELSSYLSIRLNDSLLIAPASEEGPSRRAEGIGADRLKSVQAGFLSLEEGEPLQRYLSAVRQADEDDDAENEREQGQRRMAWAIEIQIKAAPVFLPSGRMRDRRVELAHLVFLPGARKNHYPLVLSKAPSASALTSTSADDIDGATAAAASSLTARALIAHAFDYMSKRFDCRLTSSTALSSLRGPNMVRLAEAILSSTYAQIQRRRDDLDEEDRPSPPVELTFALPNQVLVDEASNKRKRGPNPRLATLSLTVPWRICRQLLVQEEANGEAVTQRKRLLLPALARYVEEHTSISTDQLSLVRMSIAAVSIGSPLSGGGLTTIAMAAGAGAGGETEAVATEMSSNTFSEPTRTTGSGAPSLGVRLKIAPLKLPDVASSFAADDDRPGVSIKDVDSWRIQDVLTELLDAAVRESW
ncbi:hypothetical protein FA10DRAFT_8763 [Acaromyces ingoldii]|uniref:Uncharacterized protein n=1 Tax=Acaromyces ingoldii TaxID=215250 RepID=A0A316YTY0_9BASI|nr:hypothetical protein FA10DRAFT_8763 [Acaromyces ingoldii]PWN92877.1 hypothetical protein FA10DRAFT_8763 [Acaromyces ingoldii]